MHNFDPASPIILAGLGNPGKEYLNTRHNIGFLIADFIAKDNFSDWSYQKKFNAYATNFNLTDKKIILVKPNTYMNESGLAIQKTLSFLNIPISNLVVIHDDLDIDFNSYRIKLGGSEAGHNGLKSISQSLADKNYIRIRVGIGRPNRKQNPANYVLSNFTVTEQKILPKLLIKIYDIITFLINNSLNQTQNKYN